MNFNIVSISPTLDSDPTTQHRRLFLYLLDAQMVGNVAVEYCFAIYPSGSGNVTVTMVVAAVLCRLKGKPLINLHNNILHKSSLPSGSTLITPMNYSKTLVLQSSFRLYGKSESIWTGLTSFTSLVFIRWFHFTSIHYFITLTNSVKYKHFMGTNKNPLTERYWPQQTLP